MNDCWNFFKYANNSDLNRIIILFKKNKWLSKYEKNYLKKKVDKKECINESGVVITFKLVKEKIKVGNINIVSNNTLLDQIIRENLEQRNNYAHHVLTKFLNCTTGNTYLSVDIDNYRAIRFFEKVNMAILDEYISKVDKKKKLIFIFEKNTIDLN